MARSGVVYVVLHGHRIVTGFTVKHELVTWVSRNDVTDFTIWRVYDGTHSRWRADLGKWETPGPTDITDAIVELARD